MLAKSKTATQGNVMHLFFQTKAKRKNKIAEKGKYKKSNAEVTTFLLLTSSTWIWALFLICDFYVQ